MRKVFSVLAVALFMNSSLNANPNKIVPEDEVESLECIRWAENITHQLAHVNEEDPNDDLEHYLAFYHSLVEYCINN